MDRTNPYEPWLDEDLVMQFHGPHETPGARSVRFDRYLAVCLLAVIGASGTVLATSLASMFLA